MPPAAEEATPAQEEIQDVHNFVPPDDPPRPASTEEKSSPNESGWGQPFKKGETMTTPAVTAPVATAPAAVPAQVQKPVAPKDLEKVLGNMNYMFEHPGESLALIDLELETINSEYTKLAIRKKRLQQMRSAISGETVATEEVEAPVRRGRRRGRRPKSETSSSADGAVPKTESGKRFSNDMTVKECILDIVSKHGPQRWKVAPMSETICKPKEQGGCGYKSTSDQFLNIVRTQCLQLEEEGKLEYDPDNNDWGFPKKK